MHTERASSSILYWPKWKFIYISIFFSYFIYFLKSAKELCCIVVLFQCVTSLLFYSGNCGHSFLWFLHMRNTEKTIFLFLFVAFSFFSYPKINSNSILIHKIYNFPNYFCATIGMCLVNGQQQLNIIKTHFRKIYFNLIS